MSEESKAGEDQDLRSGTDRRQEHRGIRSAAIFRNFLDRRKSEDRRGRSGRDEEE